METMIQMAIKALEESSCNEIELTDETGMKVKVVKLSPCIYYTNPPIYWTGMSTTYPMKY